MTDNTVKLPTGKNPPPLPPNVQPPRTMRPWPPTLGDRVTTTETTLDKLAADVEALRAEVARLAAWVEANTGDGK